MKQMIMTLGVAALALVGCGKVDDAAHDVKQRVEAPALMHTFGTKCFGANLLGLSTKSFYQFSGKSVYQVREFYKSGSCDTAAVAYVKYSGDFDLQGDSAAATGAKQVHFRWTNVTKNSTDETGAGLLKVYPIEKLPADEYNILKADENTKTVYFGDLGLRGAVTDPAKRPTKLDNDHPLYQIDKKLD